MALRVGRKEVGGGEDKGEWHHTAMGAPIVVQVMGWEGGAGLLKFAFYIVALVELPMLVKWTM